MMAKFGTIEFTATVDSSRVLPLVDALDLMVRLLDGHGHDWTDDEKAILTAATEAVDRTNLVYSTGLSR